MNYLFLLRRKGIWYLVLKESKFFKQGVIQCKSWDKALVTYWKYCEHIQYVQGGANV